ncbi:MAG: D-hexose-6-phosphate mutarotase [Polaromonas sp.]|uniref:aldose epimerase family protein n=1 Tax=Polaromonas sp. TaxID=1869339 RepID=UPI0027369E35|nr:D-hexose-6-phosphate mutarotase [Polaromonas sp.]MDP3798964.1 D-hexose-6-phosphate mutarotase [Polaromonas sp.]
MDHATGAPRLAHARLGAQVLQVDVGWESGIFYRSPIAPGDSMPARGGVPVLFPQFADRGPLPKHGLVRTARWALAQESKSDQAHSLAFELAIAPGQFADWPHAAQLVLKAEAAQDGLRLRLQVTNTGNDAFTWTGGLHPYFAVDSLQACSLAGLAGLPVEDRYDAGLTTEPYGPPGWGNEPFERLYDACPPLRLFTGSQWLTLTASGFKQWMVWNPGQEGGDAMPDLPAGDWQRFICIEPVCAARHASLLPGEVFTGTLDVRWLPSTSAMGSNT